MGAHEVLQGVQFLLSKWEAGAIPADTVLALIEIHLEREKGASPEGEINEFTKIS